MANRAWPFGVLFLFCPCAGRIFGHSGTPPVAPPPPPSAAADPHIYTYHSAHPVL